MSKFNQVVDGGARGEGRPDGRVVAHATVSVAPQLLARFSAFVAEHLGLQFPGPRITDLERGLRAAMLEFGFDDEASCVNWLLSSPLTKQQVEVLAANLTVGETYFFRERRLFEALTERIIPEIMESRRNGERNLRFWSAACCTGEEAYSMAIAALLAVPDWEKWNVTILATDINPRFLRQAASGVFGEWSFRDAPPWVKARFFTQEGGDRYVVRDEVRRLVRFDHLNLAQDAFPSLTTDTNAMDVVLCRNVLMYFEPQAASNVLQKLTRCLAPGGWLALGAGETHQTIPPGLEHRHELGGHLYRKLETGTASPTLLPTSSAESRPSYLPLEMTPNLQMPDAGALLDAMRELFERGEYGQAATNLEAAHAAGITLPPQGLTLLARSHANQGRLADALTWCDRALAADQLNPSLHYLRATILQEQGHTEEAIRAQQNAVFLDYNFALAHFALGNLARARQRRREAARHFENALGALRHRPHDEILAESDGLTAGRLAEIIRATMAGEVWS